MYDEVREAQCMDCDHREVCSLTKEFVAAQKAVGNVCVGLGDHSMKYLRDFKWIKPVKLECTHFSRKQTMRDISAENSASGIALCAGDPQTNTDDLISRSALLEEIGDPDDGMIWPSKQGIIDLVKNAPAAK